MKVIRTFWGNSLDGSVAGLVLAENDCGERCWYLGSRTQATSEEQDIVYILKWGQKILPAELLKLESLEKAEE